MIPGRIRVAELRREPGAPQHETGTVAVGSVGTTTARLDGGGQVSYEVTLEAEGNRVHLVGAARAAWVGECRRCLELTGGDVSVELAEIFEPNPTDGETFPIDDTEIDLVPVLTQALLLELPIAPLCRPDCAGPDPERYPTVVEPDEDEDPADDPKPDPRWAALAGLRLDDEPHDSDAERAPAGDEADVRTGGEVG